MRVLNLIPSEARLLASRDRCPFLVHCEIVDTGISTNDARLYASNYYPSSSLEEEEEEKKYDDYNHDCMATTVIENEENAMMMGRNGGDNAVMEGLGGGLTLSEVLGAVVNPGSCLIPKELLLSKKMRVVDKNSINVKHDKYFNDNGKEDDDIALPRGGWQGEVDDLSYYQQSSFAHVSHQHDMVQHQMLEQTYEQMSYAPYRQRSVLLIF